MYLLDQDFVACFSVWSHRLKLRFYNLLTVVKYVLRIFVLVFTAESRYMIIAELNKDVNSTVVSTDAS